MADERAAAPRPGVAARLDGRIKLLLLMAGCFAGQYMPSAWFPAWLLVLAALFFLPEMRTAGTMLMLRSCLYFVAFWLVMTAGSDLFVGKGLRDSLAAALPLGGKLLALSLVGIAYAGLSSPMETGRSAAWFVGPLAGRRVWKPALAVALVAWFLPMTLRVAGEVAAGMRARGLRLSWRRRTVLVAAASLRILERKADELAVGLASRRLDDWRSWKWPERRG